MKVKYSETINGKNVEKIATIDGFTIYEPADNDMEYPVYYFTKDREVKFTMNIECSMGQGAGFVSDITFTR